MTKKPLLQAHQLVKHFKDPKLVKVLEGVDFALEAGRSCAIMGPSGEGKSTLLHLLGTLDSPTSGEIFLEGKKIRHPDQIRNQKIGFVFQGFHLLEDYSVLDNILMPARISRKKVDIERGKKLLEQVGLSERENFDVKLLSGGERQRVAIARALMNNPRILMADEPSGNLDHATSQQIHQLLLNTVTDRTALLIVTHDAELAKLCDKRYWLQDGTLKEMK